MNLENICTEVCRIAKDAGSFIRLNITKVSSEEVEVKSEHSYVTYVDKEAEKMIIKGLSALVPEAGFIAEEGTVQPNNNSYQWIIDPLDGTTNFIHGLYPVAVSIALMKGEEVLLGVIYEVGLDECFYAWKNGGAFLDNFPIRVSEKKRVKDSLIATGFPYYDYERIKPFLNSLEEFMHNSHGVRRLGSAATDLAYVACGRFESFYEYSLSPWDVAAGSIIVEEAGGNVCDFSGGKNHIFGKEIIATNGFIYKEFLETVMKYMSKK